MDGEMSDSDDKAISCAEFQSLLPGLIDSGEGAHLHPHVQSCGLCKSLVVDLERIAEAIRFIRNRHDEDDEDGTAIVRSR
jgi:hypothetical protein